MDHVPSPYIKGGGAKAFNLQALPTVRGRVWETCERVERSVKICACQAGGMRHRSPWLGPLLNPCRTLPPQDLLAVTLETPFSVPPYMTTLEGIVGGGPQLPDVGAGGAGAMRGRGKEG